jgi:threonine/homoserine/homoserine lactone efflux protein
MELFLKGLLVGLAISIPMGSVAIFVIHRVIAHSRVSGLMVGMGSIFADLIFGVIALYGLTAVTSMINEHHTGLRVFGGALLLVIAINIFFSKPKEKVVYDVYFTLPRDFATGFILTITNPLTVLAILALFAWFGLNSPGSSFYTASISLAGFIAGLVAWWLIITGATEHYKKKIKIPTFKIINQIFGVVLFVLSILVLFKVI